MNRGHVTPDTRSVLGRVIESAGRRWEIRARLNDVLVARLAGLDHEPQRPADMATFRYSEHPELWPANEAAA